MARRWPVFAMLKKIPLILPQKKLKSALTKKQSDRAVHLYGMPAEMETIKKIAQKNKLWVIEDCAQAHLAKSVIKCWNVWQHKHIFILPN